MPDLSILMPVFNERATIEAAVADVLDTDYGVPDIELVIVDDGSTDGTRRILRDHSWGPRVRVFERAANGGKGAAVRDALDQAAGRYCAIMDADLEYDPTDVARLLEPILAGDAEVVFGTRGFESHSAFSFWYVMGNKGVTLAANLLFNAWLADIMTCHKVMSTMVMRSLDLRARGFTIEPEITAKLLTQGFQIFEVPIRYRARGRVEGKKLTATDGLRVLGTLIRLRISAGRTEPVRRSHG